MNQLYDQGRLIDSTYNRNGALKFKDKNNLSMSHLIIQRAIEKDIPIYKDKFLITKLASLDLNKDVPEKYYPAVAEIISYINKIDKNFSVENA